MDWLDLLAVQGTLKNLLQHHSLKTSILWPSAFFIVQLSHPYMTTGKIIDLTIQTFVGKVMSLLFIHCLGLGLPYSSDGKESVCNAEDPGSIPGLGRPPGEWNGNPLQYSCVENPRDGGTWWAAFYEVTQSWTRLKQLSMYSRTCSFWAWVTEW